MKLALTGHTSYQPTRLKPEPVTGRRQTWPPQPNINANFKEVSWQHFTRLQPPNVGDKHLTVQYSACVTEEEYWGNKGTNSHQGACSGEGNKCKRDRKCQHTSLKEWKVYVCSWDTGGSIFWGKHIHLLPWQENKTPFKSSVSNFGSWIPKFSLPTWLLESANLDNSSPACSRFPAYTSTLPVFSSLSLRLLLHSSSLFSPPLSSPPLLWGRSARSGAPRRKRWPPGDTWRWPPWLGRDRPHQSSSCWFELPWKMIKEEQSDNKKW